MSEKEFRRDDVLVESWRRFGGLSRRPRGKRVNFSQRRLAQGGMRCTLRINAYGKPRIGDDFDDDKNNVA